MKIVPQVHQIFINNNLNSTAVIVILMCKIELH